jgi:hypothetical protein
MPQPIRKIARDQDEIMVIDYANLNEAEMISVASQAKQAILINNKPVLVMTVFNNKSYITSTFMRHSERETKEVIHLVQNVAFVGLSPVKKMILRGYNFLFQRNFLAFDSEEEALAHLLVREKVESSSK